MYKFVTFLQNAKGDALTVGAVAVVDRSTGARVTITSDSNGTPIVENLALPDVNNKGLVAFYVDDGIYHLDFFKDRAASQFAYRITDYPMIATLSAQIGEAQAAAQAASDFADAADADAAAASGFATAASGFADDAEGYRDDAASSALTAAAYGNRFDDTTAGISGTSNGDLFFVLESGVLVEYENASGVAVATGFELAGAAALSAAVTATLRYTPDYSNPGGQGDRTGSLDYWISGFTPANGSVANLFNGSETNDATNAMQIATSATNVAGNVIGWDYGPRAQKQATELTITLSNSNAIGTYKAQYCRGSPLASNAVWEDCSSSFTLGGATSQTVALTIPVSFRALRLLGVSGTNAASSNPRVLEIKIKICSADASDGLPPAGYRGPALGLDAKGGAEYTFDGTDTAYIQDWTSNNSIRRTDASDPNWRFTDDGVLFEGGLMTLPRSLSIQTAIAVYHIDETQTLNARVLTGDGSGDAEVMIYGNANQAGDVTSHYCQDGIFAYGLTAANAVQWRLNGGWVIEVATRSSPRPERWNIMGRPGSTRVVRGSMAYLRMFDGTLADDGVSVPTANNLEPIMRKLWHWLASERGIIMHRDYAKKRIGGVVAMGASNQDGRGTIEPTGGDVGMSAISKARAAMVPALRMAVMGSRGSGGQRVDLLPLRLGLNQKQGAGDLGAFGPEVGFGIEYMLTLATAQYLPDEIVWLKAGVSSGGVTPVADGLSIDTSFHPSNTTVNSWFWSIMRAMWRIKAKLFLEGKAIVGGVAIWNGGGSDGTNEAWANASKDNLKTIITTLRTNTGINWKFVCGRVGNNETYASIVRTGQQEAASDLGGRWFSIDDLTLRDGTHFDGSDTGQVLHGKRYWLTSEWQGLAG